MFTVLHDLTVTKGGLHKCPEAESLIKKQKDKEFQIYERRFYSE